MSKLLTKFTLAALLLWFGAGAGPVLALGPVDGGDLLPTDLERVQINSPAPDFTLEDEKGTPVSLSQFRGKKNVVLVFYRGHW
jgi:cytochrome oxidase Cu insertion factor (SCO1/SenC/PrrC family)